MKVKVVTVGLSRVYNLGNYENVRPELSVTAEVEEGEEWQQRAADLYRELEAGVHTVIDRALEERGDPPRFYEGPRFALLVVPAEKYAAIVPEWARAKLPGAWPVATARFKGHRPETVRKLAAEDYPGWRVEDYIFAAYLEDGDAEAFKGLPLLERFEIYYEDGFILLALADTDLPDPWGLGRVETAVCFRETALARAAALAAEKGKVVVDLLDGDLGKLEGLKEGEIGRRGEGESGRLEGWEDEEDEGPEEGEDEEEGWEDEEDRDGEF